MTKQRLSYLFASISILCAGIGSTGCGMVSTVDPSAGSSEGNGNGNGSVAIETGIDQLVVNYDVDGALIRNFGLDELDLTGITQINVGPVDVIGGKCIASLPMLDVLKSDALANLRAQHPEVAIVLSVGGRSTFADVTKQVATTEGRDAFIGSCLGMMQDHGLSGIDLNFDQLPSGALCECVQSNGDALRDLLEGLRSKLDAAEKQQGAEFVMSVQVSANPDVLAALNPSAIHPYVDHLDIKAFDLNGAWEKVTNFGAPLNPCALDPSADKNGRTVSSVLDFVLEAGVPAKKLLLGLAFEGNGWMGVPAINDGLFQTSLGKAPGTRVNGLIDYSQIQAMTNLKMHWSDEAQMAWAYSAAGLMISFENETSIEAKIDYAEKLGLGGIMIREAGCDGQGQPLLQTVVNRLKQ